MHIGLLALFASRRLQLAFALSQQDQGTAPSTRFPPLARTVGERDLGEWSRRVWPTAAPGGFLTTPVSASRERSRFLALSPG
jgi:hypothetical protein